MKSRLGMWKIHRLNCRGAHIAGMARIKTYVEAGARTGGTPALWSKELVREVTVLNQLGRRGRRGTGLALAGGQRR